MSYPDFIYHYEFPFGVNAVEVSEKYFDQLMTHIEWVVSFGKIMGVPEGQIDVHDASKFSEEEFVPYAMKFVEEDVDEDMWKSALLHHVNHNKHHHQYWLLPPVHSIDDVLPMPFEYVQEMVADWAGASKTYNGSWEMAAWIKENVPTMWLHNDTKNRLKEVLEDVGITVLDDAWNCETTEWFYMMAAMAEELYDERNP